MSRLIYMDHTCVDNFVIRDYYIKHIYFCYDKYNDESFFVGIGDIDGKGEYTLFFVSEGNNKFALSGFDEV